MKIVKYKCPHCGAGFDIDDEAEKVKCPQCKADIDLVPVALDASPAAEVAAETAQSGKKQNIFARYSALSLNKRFLILFFGAAALFAIAGIIFGILQGAGVFKNEHGNVTSFNWYGYLIGIAIVQCVIFGQYAATKQGYYTDLVFDYVIFAVPLAFLGGIFYYAAFNDWNWGGIGVLGALIGAGIGLVLAKAIYAKFVPNKPRVALIQMLDLASVFFLMGQCIGRIGCYFGGCCYGVAVDFDMFPFSYYVAGGLHLGNPFIESIWCAIGFVPMAIMYLSRRKCFNGFFISLYCVWYGAERLVLEFFRAPAEKLTILGTDFGISQLVSILMIAFGVIWIAQYILRAKLAGKKIMILVPQDKLSDEYFGYENTIYAHPSVDAEGRAIKAAVEPLMNDADDNGQES